MFFEVSEQEQLSFRGVAGDGLVDQGPQSGVPGRGEVAEEGLQLGGEEASGDDGDELGEEAAEGDEGHERVGGAGLEGLDGEADLEGEVSGLFDEVAGEMFEVGWGEGVGVATVLEGVEVTVGGTGAARAELGVAVGAAAGVAAHGPGAAAGDLAVGFVRVSRHGESASQRVSESANRRVRSG